MKTESKINLLFASILRTFADNIESGNTNATEDELIELCDSLGYIMNPETKLSKYQAANLLGINHKTFDYYVSKGDIPKGKEQQGFKEKFWYKRDIIKFKERKNERES